MEQRNVVANVTEQHAESQRKKKDITNQWSRGKKKPMEHKIEEVRQ